MSLWLRLMVMCLFFAASTPSLAQTPLAGNAAKGKFVFLQCQACHAVTHDAPPMIGPPLAGIYGAKAASMPGYTYSDALKKSGLIWNAASLDTWLTSPSTMVPGTKMAFVGISNPALRADVIAYLAALK